MRWIGLTTALLVATGCPSGDDGGNANDTTSASSTSGTEPSTSAEDTTGTGTSSSTGTGPMAACEDASTEAECDALSADTYGCDWLLTRRVAIGAGGTCEDMNMAGGRCLQIEEESGCGDPTAPTCDDFLTTVFFDPLTVDDASIEILVAPEGVCVGGLPGWEMCGYDDAGGTGTTGDTGSTGDTATSGGLEPTWDPPACQCGCP
jgi:hypothetical protein